MIESMRMVTTVRTRIAPSPTGNDLHIGNAYTALINYVFAHKNNGQFIVRIEDTDRARFIQKSEAAIFSSLSWLGLIPDESPDDSGPFKSYRQSERLALYTKHAEKLISEGHAYRCICTPERLAQMRKKQQESKKPPLYDGKCRESKIQSSKSQKYVVRLKTPRTGKISFVDVIRGKIEFENNLMNDQIIIKSDGFPTYHLAVVVDDHAMRITHVIRGEEWISSTPKHVLLYKFLGWELPTFVHVPLLRNPDKSKLSKRRNPVWVSNYRDEGFLPQAIRNYLGTLGWAVPQELIDQNKKQGLPEEMFTLDDMITHFDLSDIKTSAPVFDVKKLRWLNGEYIRKTQNSELKIQINNFFNKRYPEEMIEKILPLVQERMKTLKEFKSLAGFFFEKPKKYESEINRDWIKEVEKTFSTIKWNHDTMLSEGRKIAENLDIKFRKLAMDIRIAIAGKKVGPPLFESMELLGKEESLSRLHEALKN